ncbi:MAG: hypothetical protein HDR88_12235 [Bacteroides sp.]|nr:hypothetical protein [Bacteroides sp.]
MKIDHIALWADDIENLKDFYVRYFNAVAGKKYYNPAKQFTSYFLTFPNGGCRLEIMNVPNLFNSDKSRVFTGFCHISISVGSKNMVNEFTEYLHKAGVAVKSNPRTTGDGYYESVVSDPEGNLIEITI